jgi:hypothetical protein
MRESFLGRDRGATVLAENNALLRRFLVGVADLA